MKKITPFLWFNDQAEQAATFYTSVFKNSRVRKIARYGEAGPGAKGTVMTVGFELEGQEFTALNGGPVFKFNHAISFVVHCRTQKEIDFLWAKLSEGGKIEQCGWLQDKYGVSWQIVPAVFLDMIGARDPDRSQRVMRAMLKMRKFDIKKLKQAYAKR